MFLAIGILSTLILLLEHPNIRTAFLLVLPIWSFCRWYYFLFYVIEKYTDAKFKFAGVSSFLAYLWKQKSTPE